jgi:protein O-GlcNAc transferase
MKPRTQTLLLTGAIVVLLLLAFDHLGRMSGRFFGRSWPSMRGLAHYLAGDYGGAARAYREELRRRASGAAPLTSSLLLARGDLEQAESRARAEAQIAPTDPEPVLTQAEIALARRDWASAVALAGRVLATRRDDYDALLVTAVAHARQGSAPAAVDALKRALRYEKAERRATVFFAVLEATGDLDDRPVQARSNCLLAHLHRYLRIYDPGQAGPATRYAQRAIETGDRADDAHVTLAMIDGKQGRPTAVLARLQQALAVNPRNTAALLGVARHRSDRGELAEAYRLTRAAFDAEPHDPFVAATLHGLLVQKLGDYRQALVLAEASLVRDAGDAEAWWRQGSVLLHLSDYPRALQSYQQAATLAPRTAELEDGIGHVLLRLGREEEALAAYQRAIALDPLRPGPHFGLGSIHGNARRWADALREYELGYALGGRDVGHVVGLCSLYLETGRRAQAGACLAEVLTRDPDHVEGWSLQEHLRGVQRSASRGQ